MQLLPGDAAASDAAAQAAQQQGPGDPSNWRGPALSLPTQVYLAGHSLGGGVGTLLAYAAQSHLGQQLGDAAPVISTALFAPPNAGSPEFVASYNERVNGRRIAYQDDLVPQAGGSQQLAGMHAC